MIDFFHIQVKCVDFGQSCEEIVDILGEFFGMADETKDTLFLVEELFES